MYTTQQLNIHGLVVPLRSCLPQHGAKFILHIVPSRPRRCYRLIATRASPVPPNLLLAYQGILIRPHDSPLPTFAGFAFCGPMQNTSQIIKVHRHNVFHVFYPTGEYPRPCCSFALRFNPAWCEVHIAHCTITSPPMLYTHLPCPRTSYCIPGQGILIRPMIHRCHLLLVVRPSIRPVIHHWMLFGLPYFALCDSKIALSVPPLGWDGAKHHPTQAQQSSCFMESLVFPSMVSTSRMRGNVLVRISSFRIHVSLGQYLKQLLLI